MKKIKLHSKDISAIQFSEIEKLCSIDNTGTLSEGGKKQGVLAYNFQGQILNIDVEVYTKFHIEDEVISDLFLNDFDYYQSYDNCAFADETWNIEIVGDYEVKVTEQAAFDLLDLHETCSIDYKYQIIEEFEEKYADFNRILDDQVIEKLKNLGWNYEVVTKVEYRGGNTEVNYLYIAMEDIPKSLKDEASNFKTYLNKIVEIEFEDENKGNAFLRNIMALKNRK